MSPNTCHRSLRSIDPAGERERAEAVATHRAHDFGAMPASWKYFSAPGWNWTSLTGFDIRSGSSRLKAPNAVLSAALFWCSALTTSYTTRSGTSTLVHRRSEEHTSELQSLRHLVCRLLLE